MPVVEYVLSHRLISEVGDINKWHNKNYTFISSPPFESFHFIKSKRLISKIISALLSKTRYEIMKCLKNNKINGPIYLYRIKKSEINSKS